MPKEIELELALGTAQLGMAYGIANGHGQPNRAVARNIVEKSFAGGVRFFDTAQAYGESETVLGRCFKELGIRDAVQVISKLGAEADGEKIENSATRSLKLLGIERFWGLLLHSESLLDLWDDPIGLSFRAMKKKGLTQRIGVSIYSPVRALQALELPDVDVIQVPANLFDRRLKRAGFFERARQLGKEIFVRSVFLQGVALMNHKHAPGFALSAVGAFTVFCAEHQLDPRQFAVNYVRHIADKARLVIGAELPEQASRNVDLLRQPIADRFRFADWDRSWPNDSFPLVDPRMWPISG